MKMRLKTLVYEFEIQDERILNLYERSDEETRHLEFVGSSQLEESIEDTVVAAIHDGHERRGQYTSPEKPEVPEHLKPHEFASQRGMGDLYWDVQLHITDRDFAAKRIGSHEIACGSIGIPRYEGHWVAK